MRLRIWMLIVPACAGLWLIALFVTGGGERGAGTAGPTRGGETAGASQAEPEIDLDDEPEPAAAPRERAASPSSPQAKALLGAPAPDQEPRSDLAATRARFAEQMREQERRNQQRFERASAHFELEPQADPRQQAAWGLQREQLLRNALLLDGVGERMRSVECRSQLCRLEVAAPEGGDSPLGRALHFRREVGVQSASGFRGEGAERVLTVFVLREGEHFDALPELKAQASH